MVQRELERQNFERAQLRRRVIEALSAVSVSCLAYGQGQHCSAQPKYLTGGRAKSAALCSGLPRPPRCRKPGSERGGKRQDASLCLTLLLRIRRHSLWTQQAESRARMSSLEGSTRCSGSGGGQEPEASAGAMLHDQHLVGRCMQKMEVLGKLTGSIPLATVEAETKEADASPQVELVCKLFAMHPPGLRL